LERVFIKIGEDLVHTKFPLIPKPFESENTMGVHKALSNGGVGQRKVKWEMRAPVCPFIINRAV
jgi:hypothetical protein